MFRLKAWRIYFIFAGNPNEAAIDVVARTRWGAIRKAIHYLLAPDSLTIHAGVYKRKAEFQAYEPTYKEYKKGAKVR